MSDPTSNSLVGVIVCDKDCYIQSVNERIADWLQCGASDLIGQRFESLLMGGGQLYFQSQCLPLLKLNGDVEEVYLSFKTSEGASLPIMFNAAMRETEGIIEFALVRIYRRALLEEELLRTKKEAMAADEAKAKFLAMMTHELRNPLGAITLVNQLLLEGKMGELTDKQRRLVTTSDEASQSLMVLITDILDFARMQTGGVDIESVQIPAGEILRRAEKLMSTTIEEAGLTYQTESVPDHLFVEGDPTRIQQILLNLLNNAMKFTPRGGKISTRAIVSGSVVKFEVEDSGPGISEADLERIFNAFVQLGSASDRGKGVGLGLAISKDLAKAMRGNLHVRSTPGEGSVFTLELPLVTDPSITGNSTS